MSNKEKGYDEITKEIKRLNSLGNTAFQISEQFFDLWQKGEVTKKMYLESVDSFHQISVESKIKVDQLYAERLNIVC